MRNDQAHPQENGAPPTAEMIAPVAAVDTLTADVTRLDTMIHDGSRPLGGRNACIDPAARQATRPRSW